MKTPHYYPSKKTKKSIGMIFIPKIRRQYAKFTVKFYKLINFKFIKRTYLGSYDIFLDVNGGSVTKNVLRYGSFQFDLFQFVNSHFSLKDLLFINIGANIGTTCLNAHFCGLRRFLAFEPVSANFELLTKNLGELRDSKISLVPKAVGSTNSTVTINLNQTSTGRHSIVTDFKSGSEQVEVIRLDDLDIEEPGFLWIDTEGYELEVIKGAINYINSFARGACIEITPAVIGQKGVSELSDLLEPHFTTYFTLDSGPYRSVKDIPPLHSGRQCDVVCLK